MKIHGVPFGADRARNTDGTQKAGTTGEYRKAGKTAVQGTVVAKDRLVEGGFAVEPEFEPRVELIESVSKRISAGEYQRPEVAETVARKLVEPAAEPDAPAEDTDAVPVQRLETISEHISAEYYDSEQVQRIIAERLAPVLGLSALFGPAAE